MTTHEFITKIRQLIARPYKPYQPSIESEIAKLLAQLDEPETLTPAAPKQTPGIDPTEAPQGYQAVTRIEGCEHCAFALHPIAFCNRTPCMSYERNDQQNVIFKPI